MANYTWTYFLFVFRTFNLVLYGIHRVEDYICNGKIKLKRNILSLETRVILNVYKNCVEVYDKQ